MTDNELQHIDPAWKTKADFVIGARIEDPIWAEHYTYEQLAVAELANGEYMICCIPFALYNICLGDYVIVNDKLNITEVVLRSDYIGFRIATDSADSQKALLDSLSSMSVMTEKYSDSLIAIAVDNALDSKKVADLLQKAETTGSILQYETINTRP